MKGSKDPKGSRHSLLAGENLFLGSAVLWPLGLVINPLARACQALSKTCYLFADGHLGLAEKISGKC